MKAGPPYAIHWFRRDLRLSGNPALKGSWSAFKGRVLGVFFVDPGILERSDLGIGRFALILEALAALSEEMRELGGELRVLEGSPEIAWPKLLAELKRAGRTVPSRVSFNRDYEPYALARDTRVERVLREDYGIEVVTEADHLLLEPAEVTKPSKKSAASSGSSSDGYRVYTPFKKRWLSLYESEDHVRTRLSTALEPAPRFELRYPKGFKLKDTLERTRREITPRVPHKLPKAGEWAARARLAEFAKSALGGYATGRDLPAQPGTSQLSIHLKHGAITIAQILSYLEAQGLMKSRGAQRFREQLIWREFYYHLLYRHPRVETEPFNRDFARIPWREGREADRDFQAWCEGRTGYPIVDAAMRQVQQTGWMHNRMRMVVSSFLTKDLLIDYRWGERFFMKKLLDGDLASNNGGWQWAASTGCDPQPWFRIFNPMLQAKRFDPRGDYVRRWLPEKERVEPIVEHDEARARTLRVFKDAAAKARSNPRQK